MWRPSWRIFPTFTLAKEIYIFSTFANLIFPLSPIISFVLLGRRYRLSADGGVGQDGGLWAKRQEPVSAVDECWASLSQPSWARGTSLRGMDQLHPAGYTAATSVWIHYKSPLSCAFITMCFILLLSSILMALGDCTVLIFFFFFLFHLFLFWDRDVGQDQGSLQNGPMERYAKEIASGLIYHKAQHNSGGSRSAFQHVCTSMNIWLYAELLFQWNVPCMLGRLSVLKSWNACLKYYNVLVLLTFRFLFTFDADQSLSDFEQLWRFESFG